ncbi:MAG: hypothetical protein ACRD0N_02005 [Acidimicrobiales bacterium]
MLPDLDPGVWHRLPSPVQRSDSARTRLLHDHGGLWLDFDCIVVADLAGLVEHLDRNEVVSWAREAVGRFYNNLFAARPGAKSLGNGCRPKTGTEVLRRLDRSALGRTRSGPDVENACTTQVGKPAQEEPIELCVVLCRHDGKGTGAVAAENARLP